MALIVTRKSSEGAADGQDPPVHGECKAPAKGKVASAESYHQEPGKGLAPSCCCRLSLSLVRATQNIALQSHDNSIAHPPYPPSQTHYLVQLPPLLLPLPAISPLPAATYFSRWDLAGRSGGTGLLTSWLWSGCGGSPAKLVHICSACVSSGPAARGQRGGGIERRPAEEGKGGVCVGDEKPRLNLGCAQQELGASSSPRRDAPSYCLSSPFLPRPSPPQQRRG